MQYSRQDVADVLRHAGFSELADEASRVLPDPVDLDQLQEDYLKLLNHKPVTCGDARGKGCSE